MTPDKEEPSESYGMEINRRSFEKHQRELKESQEQAAKGTVRLIAELRETVSHQAAEIERLTGERDAIRKALRFGPEVTPEAAVFRARQLADAPTYVMCSNCETMHNVRNDCRVCSANNERRAAEQALAARDREWLEVLHPGNADTLLGQTYDTLEKYKGFKHAQDCYGIEQQYWNGKLQDCLARLSIALYGHDQAYYDSDDSDGDNWRDNIDRFTLTLVNLIQSPADPRKAAMSKIEEAAARRIKHNATGGISVESPYYDDKPPNIRWPYTRELEADAMLLADEFLRQHFAEPGELPDLGQLFENRFNCYADAEAEEVIMAMTKDRFVEVVGKLIRCLPSSEPRELSSTPSGPASEPQTPT